MRLKKILAGTSVAILMTIGFGSESRYFSTFAQSLQVAKTAGVAVDPQYDTTHVFVAPQDFDRFVASLIATFGGTTTKQGIFTVTPTPSSTMSQLVMTPVGTVSVFGFKTPFRTHSGWNAQAIWSLMWTRRSAPPRPRARIS
jgi:hypothetical protein